MTRMEKKGAFSPRILCFLCRWCGYSAADLSGLQRIQYPPSIRSIEVACSGMVHPNWVVNSLRAGIDGVMIFGCHLGQCHYGSGNELALKRKEVITETLFDMGIDERRFSLNWISAAEGEPFARAVQKMTEILKGLGPNSPLVKVPFSRTCPVYDTSKVNFIYSINGKDYFWDGNIHEDNLSAHSAISHYLNEGFEAKLVPSKGKILIYTRREPAKQGVNDTD